MLILVPAMARILCNTYLEQIYDLSSLRVTLVGAGAITDELYNSFKNRYGVLLLSNYGSTETGGIISRIDPLRYNSIGKPMIGVEIKICKENGECVSQGEEGEIWVKCDGMLKGYLDETESPFDQQGFFPMGDIAIKDIEGYLYIKGRKKFIINVGGKKVNPYEVEEVLYRFPGVNECAVIGVNKPNGEEVVKAFIVCDNNTDEDLIKKFCSGKLSKHKIPSIIRCVKSLPKNKLGKIMREELKKGESVW